MLNMNSIFLYLGKTFFKSSSFIVTVPYKEHAEEQDDHEFSPLIHPPFYHPQRH